MWNKTRNMANLEHVSSLALPQQAESQSTLLLLWLCIYSYIERLCGVFFSKKEESLRFDE